MTRAYLLTIAARDGLSTDSVRLTSTFRLKVKVEDVNDNAPLVVISTLTGTDGEVAGVRENGAPGVLVALVTVSDHDSHLNGQATCYTDSEAFTLVALRTGHRYKLITTRLLDREATPSFHVRVTCTDLGRIPLTGNATITINVLDVNDFRPVFPAVEFEFRIRETAPLGSKVGVVKARDDDLNPDLVYAITGTNVLEVTSGGQLILAEKLDYDDGPTGYEFSVEVKDNTNASATCRVTLTVEDVNDESPLFAEEEFTFRCIEGAAAGTLLGRVSASDRDVTPEFSRMRYSLVTSSPGSHVTVDPMSGDVRLSHITLDRELADNYTYQIEVRDLDLSTLKDTSLLVIHVLDLNDNPPVSHTPNGTVLQISARLPVGRSIYRIYVTDRDPTSVLSFRLTSNDPDFRLDPRYGVIRTGRTFDEVLVSRDFPLLVEISDTVHSIEVLVVVRVNATLATPPSGDGRMRRTLMISLILVALTLLVVTVLVVAIALVKRKRLRHTEFAVSHCCVIVTPRNLVGHASLHTSP